MIVGTYWPYLVSSKTQVEAFPLWSKVERWMHQHQEKGSPLTYIQQLISGKTNGHINNRGKSTGNIAIMGGDLNSNFRPNGSGGCHKGTVKWAEEAGWRNQSYEIAKYMNPPLTTHWSDNGPHTWIDHILVHDTSITHL